MKICSWPSYTRKEIKAANKVLRSGEVNYWTGSESKLFEKEFSKWCGVNNSVALANGTLALSAIYEAIGLGNGDEFITTPRSFIATASAGALLGAKPIFVDVDRDSGCITPETILTKINSKTNLYLEKIGYVSNDTLNIKIQDKNISNIRVEELAEKFNNSISGHF